MDDSISNPCSRCGRQRVATRTHREKTASGYVTYTQTVCPNPDCQKKVDVELAKEKQKRQEIKKDSERREAERQKKAKNPNRKDIKI